MQELLVLALASSSYARLWVSRVLQSPLAKINLTSVPPLELIISSTIKKFKEINLLREFKRLLVEKE